MMPPVSHPTCPSRTPLLAACILGVLAALALVPLALEARTRDRLYAAEGSFVEWASCVAWALLAVAIPVILRRASPSTLAGSVLALACAAREADLHNALTGYSVLKPRFLLDSNFPLGSRLIALAVLSLVALSAYAAGRSVLRHARAAGGVRASWVRWTIGLPVAAIALKGLDRIPTLYRSIFGRFDESLLVSLRSLEENLEFLLPLGALHAILLFRSSLILPASTATPDAATPGCETR